MFAFFFRSLTKFHRISFTNFGFFALNFTQILRKFSNAFQFFGPIKSENQRISRISCLPLGPFFLVPIFFSWFEGDVNGMLTEHVNDKGVQALPRDGGLEALELHVVLEYEVEL